jgi:serine/threonine protein kinase, bacterial
MGVAMSHSQPLQVGSVPYPGYRLRQLISRGGFGDVWEAETDDGQTLALKFLPSSDSLVTAKEIRAIQAIGHLHHPGLIRIDQVWCHLGYIIIAMELAEGSLLDLLEVYMAEYGTAIAPAEVCRYLTQLAGVLDFLNRRQHQLDGRRVAFQHCDVKPSNILLFGENIKLCDFGLSSVTTAALRFHYRAGTLDYAAPEIFQGRLSDWTDQYALAVTYVQLRTGMLPFTDTPATFVRGYVRPAPDLARLPRPEQPIVARALAAVPQDRWPSCGEFMSRLTRVIV